MTTPDPTAPPACPELLAYDLNWFRERAPVRVLRDGISWYRDHRITRLEEQPEGIRAWFGAGPDGEPETIVYVVGTDGELSVDAMGGAPWEHGDHETPYAYAIAACYAYQAQHTVTESALRGARERAISDRIVRAREEVAVRHRDGDAPWGTYEAWSLGISRPGHDRYLVHLRSPRYHINGCTCPDFLKAGLGMCKHTEAVRAANQKRRSRPQQATPFALFDGRGTHRWMLLVPSQLVDALTGALPAAARRAEVEALPLADGVTHDRQVDVFDLGGVDEDAMALWVDRWMDDPRFDVGHDVLAMLELAESRARRSARTRRWRRWFSGWDGNVDGLRVTPFPYQRDGIAFLVERGRALLADDMGLGKTLQAIAATTLMVERGEVDRALVVCPTSLVHQWCREIERFTDLAVVAVEGGRSARVAALRGPGTVFVTTYDRMRLDFDTIQSDLRPDLLVLDEAQRVKNWATRNAQHVAALDTEFVFVLTGTPIENRLEELYALTQVVEPSIFGPLWRFFREFAVLDTTGRPVGYRGLLALRERIAPWVLRRERVTVLDQLPERTDVVIDVELSRTQQSVHDEARETATRIAAIMGRRPLTPVERQRLLAALQRARMACDSAAIVDDALPWQSPKLDVLAELLQELCIDEERKVVVFSEWVRMGDLAARMCTELGIGWVQLNGSVPAKQRPNLIRAFETDPKVRVFISSDAGSTGLNLQAASALVHLDCPWNPAILEQRSARIHRQGQASAVQIIRLIARQAYEGHVAALVESKRELFTSVLGTAGDDAMSLGAGRLDAMLAALESSALEPRAPRPAMGARAGAEVDPHDHDGDAASAIVVDHASGDGVEASVAQPADTVPDAPEAASRLERGLAALDVPSHDRSRRLELLAGLLRELPGDADIIAVDGGLLVAVDEPDALERAVDLSAFAPLRCTIVTRSHCDTLLAYLRVRSGDAPIKLDRAAVADAASDAPADFASAGPASGAAVMIEDPRLTSARVLWEAGQNALALELLWTAELDAIASELGTRAPHRDDAWRWLYAEALPQGAVDAERAGQLAHAMSLATQASPDRAMLDRAWLGLAR